MSLVRDKSLAPLGLKKINWVREKEFMPVLAQLEKEFVSEKPFAGLKIAMSIHLEAKTAYLALLLRSGGADVAITGSNTLSTKDEICAALDSLGINIYAWHGATEEEYVRHLKETLAFKPNIIIDDGGDLVSLLHGECAEYATEMIGGCEETTTGLLRLRARVREGRLNFPMMAVNDANCKHLFDNVHGTGQSVWDAIMYTTNVQVTGKVVVVAGYGFCSRGIATRAKGLGARVIVTEINPFKCLEAAMDGFEVLKMDDAAKVGDIFISSTGCRDVITARHFKVMKNNVLLANAGHFDIEVNKVDLAEMSDRIEERKPYIDGYYLKDGRVINVLADGKLVNIVAGNGHPADIMDLSFAIQALSALYVARRGKDLTPGLYDIPEDIDYRVAIIKLTAMGLGLDELTPEQKAYLDSTGE
ncbi:MAG: adenosylhomocysteinase [Clostridiales bacterium]|jgi:adenosylhomocysteinase|nr:adenosylhomocysteinase [Clostridiales bacterium]